MEYGWGLSRADSQSAGRGLSSSAAPCLLPACK